MTLMETEDTWASKRMHWVALCEEFASEEVTDLLQGKVIERINTVNYLFSIPAYLADNFFIHDSTALVGLGLLLLRFRDHTQTNHTR
jgi:hypothetical protein